MLAGLFEANTTVISIWATLVGRIIYGLGYKANPKFRVPGFLIVSIANMTNMVNTFYGFWK